METRHTQTLSKIQTWWRCILIRLGLQGGDLQSGANDLGFRNAVIALHGDPGGGNYSLGYLILDFAMHSLQWGPTRWEPTVSGNRIWISQRTYCTENLQGGNIQFRATDFGSRNALIAQEDGNRRSRATDFGSRNTFIALGSRRVGT